MKIKANFWFGNGQISSQKAPQEPSIPRFARIFLVEPKKDKESLAGGRWRCQTEPKMTKIAKIIILI